MPEDFRIARLTSRDAKGGSDHLMNLREFVSQSEDSYPGIDRWFDKKVIPGLTSNSRVAYVGYLDQRPAAAAIIKLDTDAKICHISIKPDLQNIGLGDVFFCLLAMEARRVASTIHLTLPESLWSTKKPFFEGFGFTELKIAETQYRLFDKELSTRTAFKDVWNAVLSKITKISKRFSLGGNTLSDGLLFSVRPEYGEMIMNGSKTIELRRRFSKKWRGHRAVFYATEPVCGILGQADIAEVYEGSPKTIWARFAPALRCSHDYYESYVAGCKAVFAISLRDAKPYVAPVFAGTLTQYTARDLVPPQSYLHLHEESGWAEAVNIAVMLQCLHKRFAVASNAHPSRLTMPRQSDSSMQLLSQPILPDPPIQKELF